MCMNAMGNQNAFHKNIVGYKGLTEYEAVR